MIYALNKRKRKMLLLDTLKADLKTAMIEQDDDKKNALRLILGEIPRLNKSAGQNVSDDELQKIITKMIKSETVVMKYNGQKSSTFIDCLEGYLPKMMNKGDVESWIIDNIDLSQFNPKMKAMGSIMKHLKGKVDGNIVKDVLLGISDFIESK